MILQHIWFQNDGRLETFSKVCTAAWEISYPNPIIIQSAFCGCQTQLQICHKQLQNNLIIWFLTHEFQFLLTMKRSSTFMSNYFAKRYLTDDVHNCKIWEYGMLLINTLLCRCNLIDNIFGTPYFWCNSIFIPNVTWPIHTLKHWHLIIHTICFWSNSLL